MGSTPGSNRTKASRPSPKELGTATALGALIALLLFALRADRMPGDSSGLVNLMATEDGPLVFWYHLGYAWLARLVQAVFAGPLGLNVRETLELLSALAAGASVPLCYATLRRLGGALPAAMIGTLAMVSLISFWNHGTIIEVHTVQLLAGWAGLCLMARAALLAPARLFATSLLAGLIVSTAHQTGPLLFPGLVLASIWTAGPKLSRPEQLKRFSIACAAFLCALGISRYLTSVLSPFDKLKDLSDFTSSTAMLTKGLSWDFFMRELLIPLNAIALLTIFMLRKRMRTEPIVWLGLVLAVVPWVFFLGFGERTEGGYFLGSSIGCVLLVSALWRAENRCRAPIAASIFFGVLVSPYQLFLGAHGNQNSRARDRTETVSKLLPNGGTLITLPYSEHTLNGQFADIDEVILCGPFRQYIEKGYVADGAYLFLNERLEELDAAGGTLLIDWTWSYRYNHPEPKWQQSTEVLASERGAGEPLYLEESWQPYLDEVRKGLERDWIVTEVHGPWSLFLRIDRRL